jgi:hypothetical protein
MPAASLSHSAQAGFGLLVQISLAFVLGKSIGPDKEEVGGWRGT